MTARADRIVDFLARHPLLLGVAVVGLMLAAGVWQAVDEWRRELDRRGWL